MKPQTHKMLAAFSIDHASRVTGISKSRLAQWDKKGFFSPEYLEDYDRGNAYARVYSFTDLVGLRTIAILVDDYKISIRELAATYPELAKNVQRPWANTQLAVWKKKVVWDLQSLPRDRHGQYVGNHIELKSVASEVAAKAEELRRRSQDLVGATEKHRYVARNAEVVAGTRIPVSTIRSFIDAGFSDTAIISEYPTLTKGDVERIRSSHKRVA